MNHYDFKKDLPIAQACEAEVAARLVELFDCEFLGDNNDNRYDLAFRTAKGRRTVEVKQDFTCAKTGNVGVEFSCRGKPSGIATSKADYYAYVVHTPRSGRRLYFAPTRALKDLIASESYHRTVNGGDPGSNSLNHLFRLSVFAEAFDDLGEM